MYVRKQKIITPHSRSPRPSRRNPLSTSKNRATSRRTSCGVVATINPRDGCASASSPSSTSFGQFGCQMRGCCWCCRCFSIYIYHRVHTLHVVEALQKQNRARRDVVGGRHRLCTHSRVFHLQLHRPKLPDTILLARAHPAHGRLPMSQ